MGRRIDFNCDMGEGYGAWTLGCDEEIIRHVTSANIACGFHAGDPQWMRRTVRLAERHGVGVGAHPGFPDLRGFGRRNIAVAPAEACDDLIYQAGALSAFTSGRRLQHLKPHGALYNLAMAGGDIGRAVCDAVLQFDPGMILLVLAGSPMVRLAGEMGVRVAQEAFADRSLNADGTLVERSRPGAVIHDLGEVIERTVRLATTGTATAITGEEVRVQVDTICLHGDTPGAVQLASALGAALKAAGVELLPLGRR
jgi:5-oxoprolinase (ATP-hydrolysing) subunit A